MPREVELRLTELLEQHPSKMSWATLCERIGISEATLRDYRDNYWKVLDRTVLERLADLFQCDASSLLTTRQHNFFKPFLHVPDNDRYPVPTCFYLRRSDADQVMAKRARAHRDNRALDHITKLLEEWVDEIVDVEKSATTIEEFNEHISQSCIVVGSPWVNPATEIAICRAFGAEPFNPSDCAKIPFAFRVADPKTNASAVVEDASGGGLGIGLRGNGNKRLVKADTWPKEQFRQAEIEEGHDCALVMVFHHHPTPQKDYIRKLIVLSGFSGVGTEAAALALTEGYRDFEPLEKEHETLVWGLLDVSYQKNANDNTRILNNYKWRYRVGGRAPMGWVSK